MRPPGPPWGRRPRQRPPWWPESEPWPPQGPPSWVRGRLRGRRFLLAVALFAAVLTLLVATGAALAYLLIRAVPGSFPGSPGGRLLVAAALGIVLFALVMHAQGLGRGAAKLLQAAARIETGDYAVRIDERVPRALRPVVRAFNAMSAQLEARDDLRQAMLADLTHELRTPLSIIRGQAEAIADGVYAADADHLAPILEATRTLEDLVADLGTRVHAGAGALPLRRGLTDLRELVDDSLAAFAGAAEQKGVDVKAEMEPALPELELDAARVRGVLGNLLSNAIRHTPAGGSVTVAARREADGVALTVADTGDGIPPDVLHRVFERYVKGPSSTGTGLGLAIARDVVKAHGGRIEAESRPGKGTTIRLFLPLG
ncbi:MAG: HAMP domain-containing histidine kinase [Chloroflexi bacterium]|nr:MAG: HAMP domain-containing histidine kinase [Chloroflexota bacterium]